MRRPSPILAGSHEVVIIIVVDEVVDPASVENARGSRPLPSCGSLHLRRARRGIRAVHALRTSRGTRRGPLLLVLA